MNDSITPPKLRHPAWPWLLLVLGLAGTAWLRAPLILNAEWHLDSDLAVDGITLRDAAQGHWRWHYPGTPHMGILPVLLSYPQALLFGTDARTLVSGGTVAWLLVVSATFALAWKTYGRAVACWALIPLVFSSLRMIWLSSRITGGHLLTLAWHSAAFWGLHVVLSKGGLTRMALGTVITWLPANVCALVDAAL